MSEQQTQQTPLTFDGILELMRENERKFVLMSQETDRKIQETSEQMKETDRKMKENFEQTKQLFAETDRKMKETDRLSKETERKISALGSRIGEIVENMIGNDIIAQFQALGYSITRYSRSLRFGPLGTEESGEVDLYIEDGDVAILVEAKTTLKTEDVLEHIERLEKYRRCMDAAGTDSRRFIGAVAGAVVEPNVAAFAQKHGMYVIAQSGKAFEIVPSPEGFVPKKW